MGIQEEHPDEIVIRAAWSAHCKRHENDGIWTISVQSPIVQDLRTDRVLRAPSGWGDPCSEHPTGVQTLFPEKSMCHRTLIMDTQRKEGSWLFVYVFFSFIFFSFFWSKGVFLSSQTFEVWDTPLHACRWRSLVSTDGSPRLQGDTLQVLIVSDLRSETWSRSLGGGLKSFRTRS